MEKYRFEDTGNSPENSGEHWRRYCGISMQTAENISKHIGEFIHKQPRTLARTLGGILPTLSSKEKHMLSKYKKQNANSDFFWKKSFELSELTSNNSTPCWRIWPKEFVRQPLRYSPTNIQGHWKKPFGLHCPFGFVMCRKRRRGWKHHHTTPNPLSRNSGIFVSDSFAISFESFCQGLELKHQHGRKPCRNISASE